MPDQVGLAEKRAGGARPRTYAALVAATTLLAACPGGAPRFDGRTQKDSSQQDYGLPPDAFRSDHSSAETGAPETGAPDTGGPDTGTVHCSAAGVAATCDPIGGVGCQSGTCYVIAGKGTACVCPAGGKTAGTQCTTTTECAPGHGCAGNVAPGICRRFCNSLNQTCQNNESCTPITGQTTWGMCVPK